MSTIEELFLQIFERKKWIIDQVKQQSDLFDQYLASNCLINGIQPPPWLLNIKGTTQFRGLPFLPTRPNNVAYATSRPTFPGKIPQDSNTLPTTTCSLDKGEQTRLNTTSSLEVVLESNPAISSPVQTQPRVPGTNLHLDQSLARIQRSRSRQKALELRNSVEVKSAKVNSTTAFPDIITSSSTSARHSKRVKENSEQHKFENSTDGGCFKIREPTPVNYQLDSPDNTLQPSDFVDGENEVLKDQLSKCAFQSPVSAQQDKLLGANTDDKISSKVHKANESCGNIMMPQTDPQASQVGCVNELLQLGKSEEHPSGRINTCSRSSASNKFSQLGAQGNIIEGRDPMQASDAHLIAELDNGHKGTGCLEKCNVGIADNDFDSVLPAEACLNCMGSNLVGNFEVEGFSDLNLPPDADIFVEPKQLFFDDEDCALNSTPKQEALEPPKKLVTSDNTFGQRGLTVDVEMEERNHTLEIVDREEERRTSYESCKKGMLEFTNKGAEPKKLVTSDNTFGQRGLTVEVEVEERNHTLEVVDREEERRTSYESCKQGMFEFTNKGAECNSHPSVSSSKVLNVSTLSKVKSEISKQLGKLTPEIQGTVVVNTYSGKKSIPSIENSPSDHLMCLKDGRNSSGGSQLQGDVNQMEASLSKTSDQKLDVGAAEVSSEICKFVSISDGLQKFLSHDLDPVIHVSGRNENEVLLREQETEYVGTTGGGNRSILTQVITPKSAQISNTRQEVSSLPSSCIGHDENDGFSRSNRSSSATSLINSKKTVHNASVDSWPPYKRRKVEARPSAVFTTATRLTTVEPLHQIDENGISRSHRHEDGLTASLECTHVTSSSGVKASQSNSIEKLDAGTCGRVKHSKTDKYVSLPSLQATKDDGVMKGGEEGTQNCTVFRQPWVDGTLDSNWNENERANASELSGLTDISFTQLASEVHQNASFHQSKLNLQTVKEMSSADETPQDMGFIDGEQQLSYHSVRSPNAEDLDLIVANESIPELEGFSIDMSAEEKMPLSSDELCLKNLPTTSKERISVLEKLCKSASKVTPLPQSSKHKIHRIPDICHSLPNGLLERTDPRNACHFSNEDFKELKASYNFLSSTADLASYSGCVPTSCVQLDFGIRKPPDTPHPARMLGQKIASVPARHSFEKQQSLNPELTCFRIDEDSNSSEDGNLLDEEVDIFHKGTSPRESDHSSLRRPLVDMTNSRPLPSLSGTKNVHDRTSTDSVNTESYMHRTRTSDKQKLRNTCGSNRKAKKNKGSQSSLMSGNVVGKASKSSYNMSPKLLRKPSEGNKSQSFVDKGYTRANIVSNVSSFIPFVQLQQKQQPAAFAAGKRDVKVKALEAAEAAKRLEEKRENDRRMKKEAAKLERARLEEEKSKQLVLKQKEEREKKGADMAAKKRLREEKDRKEKVKQRKCIEDSKRQQKEQEKFRSEKEEKQQRHRYADEKEGKQNDLLRAEQKHPKAEKGSQIAESRIRAETGTTVGVAVEDAIDVRSDLCEENNCDFSFSKARGDDSYQISPYQASDNEEEEEQDTIPNKKFVPSWAREKYLASVMPLMQQVDPYTIFPSSRVCNISQVLLPRACSK